MKCTGEVKFKVKVYGTCFDECGREAKFEVTWGNGEKSYYCGIHARAFNSRIKYNKLKPARKLNADDN